MTTAKVLPITTQPSTSSFFVTTHNSHLGGGGWKNQQSAASMGGATSMGSFVVAKNDDPNDEANAEETESYYNKFNVCCEVSIRTTLMILISGLVILSIIIVVATFCASFLPGFLSVSNDKRDNDFINIVSFSEKTLKELVITNKVTQMQFEENYSMYNFPDTELKIFRAFKAEHIYHDDIFVTTYVGDSYGAAICIMKWTEGPAYLNISLTHNEFHYCRDYEHTTFCNRSSTPDEVDDPFDLSYLVQVCNENPGKVVYSDSYADPSMPSMTFITLLNCIPKKTNNVKPGSNFEYYYAIDTTTATISTNLKSSTKQIEGSHAYIVEASTGYMIAAYDNTPLMGWSSDHQLIRYKPDECANEEIKKVDRSIKELFPKGYASVDASGKIFTTQSGDDTTTFKRLKTDYGIDWIIVLASPTWNYTAPIAIALIASFGGSMLAIIISLIASIIVSVRIVKPFHGLIEMITSISTIDIEAGDLSNTIFSEVRELQYQFYQMVKRLKLYRSFIPPHLIQEIEKLENEGDESKQKEMIKQVSTQNGLQQKSSSASLMSASGHNFSSRKKKIGKATLNRFSLYLERKVVTVVYMSMDGILDCLDNMEHSDIVFMLGDIFEQVNQIGKTTSGLVYGFENGALMIAFNATANQAAHQEKAATATLTLIGKLDNVRKTKWAQTQSFKSSRQISYMLDNISFRFCITSRETTCGNVGTNEAKIFSIFGNLRQEFELMAAVAREVGIQILVTEQIYQVVNQIFVLRYIDSKEMSLPYPSVQESDSRIREECHLYELIESKTVQNDEWMFELEEKKRKEKWKLYNEACQFYKDKKLDHALDLLKIFSSDHPNDKPTQHLIAACLQKLHETDKCSNKQ